MWRPEHADALYPEDLHATAFSAGTSLIAKRDGAPIGFLFGFFTFGGPTLPRATAARHPDAFRLESQVMAVLPGQQGGGIGRLLKLRQAEIARREGVHVVNWTFDPLLVRQRGAEPDAARRGRVPLPSALLSVVERR